MMVLPLSIFLQIKEALSNASNNQARTSIGMANSDGQANDEMVKTAEVIDIS